jgi:hypothetical protein
MEDLHRLKLMGPCICISDGTYPRHCTNIEMHQLAEKVYIGTCMAPNFCLGPAPIFTEAVYIHTCRYSHFVTGFVRLLECILYSLFKLVD